MKEIALCSFISVLKLVLVALLGLWLGKKEILNKSARQSVSKMIMLVMLPSLLIVSLGKNASFANIGEWMMLPFMAFFMVVCGMVISGIGCRLFRIPSHLHKVICAATSFGNSSYIPLPLLATVTATAPLFINDPQAGERSYAYVSIYLLVHSPILWAVGFPFLSGRSWREIKPSQIISPPLIASIAGLLIGSIPCLHNLFFSQAAPLKFLVEVMDMLGKAIFPCALLMLGANLSEKLPEGEMLPKRAFIALCLFRLLFMPIVGILLAFIGITWKLVPLDSVFLIVMMVETAVPPATNLIVMTQVQKQGEAAMSRLLFVTYCMSIPILTANMTLFMYLIDKWLAN